jgi:hypothetical protein
MKNSIRFKAHAKKGKIGEKRTNCCECYTCLPLFFYLFSCFRLSFLLVSTWCKCIEYKGWHATATAKARVCSNSSELDERGRVWENKERSLISRRSKCNLDYLLCVCMLGCWRMNNVKLFKLKSEKWVRPSFPFRNQNVHAASLQCIV